MPKSPRTVCAGQPKKSAMPPHTPSQTRLRERVSRGWRVIRRSPYSGSGFAEVLQAEVQAHGVPRLLAQRFVCIGFRKDRMTECSRDESAFSRVFDKENDLAHAWHRMFEFCSFQIGRDWISDKCDERCRSCATDMLRCSVSNSAGGVDWR
jgi:hypothetical protein